MLNTLRIKNLALVEDLTLELEPGFNAITGETGAGKSIIIGALNLLLGGRADRTLIRSGSDSCTVEAVFDIYSIRAVISDYLEKNGIEACDNGQLVIKRSFSGSGANRQFINGSPAGLAALSAVGEWLVDMHGPHDHQSLLHPSRQLDILDAFGKLDAQRSAFSSLTRHRQQLESAKAALIVDEKTYAQRLDLLRHQSGEIKAARLHPEEEAALETEYKRASNSARLLELSQGALNLIAENEPCIVSQLGALGKMLHDLARLDSGTANQFALHEQVCAQVRDLQNVVGRYADRLDLDPARLQELEERLNVIHSLKRKYGSTLNEVLAYGEKISQELQSLEQRDAELERINSALHKLDADIRKAGEQLSALRRKLIPQLSKSVSKHLSELGFKQSLFDVEIKTEKDLATFQRQIPSSGLDTVEFQFAPNPGEPVRSLRAIASSGELSRVMLALKTVLAVEDQVPVLIFDEVDANVGGETAHAVGEKMSRIGSRRQVLCITHLAPVAAAAKNHYSVSKHVKDGRTISKIERLEGSSRIEELSRMLGGGKAAVQHARALLTSDGGKA